MSRSESILHYVYSIDWLSYWTRISSYPSKKGRMYIGLFKINGCMENLYPMHNTICRIMFAKLVLIVSDVSVALYKDGVRSEANQ